MPIGPLVAGLPPLLVLCGQIFGSPYTHLFPISYLYRFATTYHKQVPWPLCCGICGMFKSVKHIKLRMNKLCLSIALLAALAEWVRGHRQPIFGPAPRHLAGRAPKLQPHPFSTNPKGKPLPEKVDMKFEEVMENELPFNFEVIYDNDTSFHIELHNGEEKGRRAGLRHTVRPAQVTRARATPSASISRCTNPISPPSLPAT